MIYEPLAAKEHQSGREMTLSYQRVHDRLIGNQTLITSLKLSLEQERAARRYDVETLQARIVEMQAELDELRWQEPVPVVDVQYYSFPRILRAVCRVHQVTVGDIKGVTRNRRIFLARMHIIHILTMKRPDLSTLVLGRLLDRHHATILNARRRWSRFGEQIGHLVTEVELQLKITAQSTEEILVKPVDSVNNPEVART